MGRNPKPEGFYGWRGATSGGCGVWATAMCNRILGSTPPTRQVDETEWNGLADALSLSASGGTTSAAEMAYYRARGWCVEDKKFHGTAGDYAELSTRFQDDHCDVKFDYFRRVGDHYANGHVETVTGVSGTSATTNSWGHEAMITGGSDGHFRHSGDGVWMTEDDGSRLWPDDETDVWVTYVCECRLSRRERLAQFLFGD